jgi:hypothetical protein
VEDRVDNINNVELVKQLVKKALAINRRAIEKAIYSITEANVKL